MYETLTLYIDGEFIGGGGRTEQEIVNPASDSNLSLLDRLHRDAQRNLVADLGGVLAHVEVRAPEGGDGVGTAGIFFRHRMRHAFEGSDLQRHGLGDALDCQQAVDGLQLLSVESKVIRYEPDLRVFGGIEEIFGLNMFVENRKSRVDRTGIDPDIGASGSCFPVERDRSAGFVEPALLVGKSEVAVFKPGKSMGVVDNVGFGRGLRHSDNGHHRCESKNRFHH